MPLLYRSSSEFLFFVHETTQVQRRGGDEAVQWVLKGQEDAWYYSSTVFNRIGPGGIG